MGLKINCSRSLLAGRQIAVQLRAPLLKPQDLTRIVDFSLIQVLGRDLLHGHEVSDRKGRHPGVPLSSLAPAGSRADAEELLYLSGSCREEAEDNEKSLSEEEAVHPFSVSITSEFLRFNGLRHIVYQPRERRNGALRPGAFLGTLTSEPELKIDYLRVGVDFYRPRLFWIFGLSPTMYQSLYLEANQKELDLKLSAESLANKNSLPVADRQFFTGLISLIKDVTGVNLEAGYAAQIQ